MADMQHKNITDPQIHEPKGISTATAGTYYIADGEGSGEWGRDSSQDVSTLFQIRVTWTIAYYDVCYPSQSKTQTPSSCAVTTLSGDTSSVSVVSTSLQLPPGLYTITHPVYSTGSYVAYPSVCTIASPNLSSHYYFTSSMKVHGNASYYSAGNLSLSYSQYAVGTGTCRAVGGSFSAVITRVRSFY